MPITVQFIERGFADTPSIERVFRQIAAALENKGVLSKFTKLPYGNGVISIIRNMALFRPGDADVYHITGHAHYMAIVLPIDKSVLTIHDAGILRLRSGLRRFLLKKLLFDWPIRRFRWITTISDATKRELVHATGCDPSKIRVIGNPVPGDLFHVEKEFDAENPVVLIVGAAPHKNLERSVRGLTGLNCRIRIIGDLTPAQKELLDASGLKYSAETGLDDAGMRREYENADIILFCTLFEGFGMPIIEAQACGRPLITSDLSPMREVAGKGAILVDPWNVFEIRDAVRRVIEDAELRRSLIEHGLQNVLRFRADTIAERYFDLYREMTIDLAR